MIIDTNRMTKILNSYLRMLDKRIWSAYITEVEYFNFNSNMKNP